MLHDAKKLLEDIRIAAQMIADFTLNATESGFVVDLLTRSAVERQFIVIGEALRALGKLDAATARQITDAARIIGFRNVLVHGYDVVDPILVWKAVQSHLPLPAREVAALLIAS